MSFLPYSSLSCSVLTFPCVPHAQTPSGRTSTRAAERAAVAHVEEVSSAADGSEGGGTGPSRR
eukprot:3020629-Pleurochrysis_carterae.AAC.1